MGDGWEYLRLYRFRIFVYEDWFADVVRRMVLAVKRAFELTSSESRSPDRLTGTIEWIFEIGGEFAVKGLNLGLLKTPKGLYFLAGLWDADGNWSRPDEGHPMGQATFFGGLHAVRVVERSMKLNWGFAAGRNYIATHEGHVSRIGDHTITTRTNVYGIIIKAKSMASWVDQVGSKMILKKRALAA